MSKPLVTVIMSVYNEEQFVKDAIQSILNQTYKNFEFIIIDDYSTDRSLEFCKSFDDPRIRIYSKTNEPRFLAASRNLGVKLAIGDYVLLHDADDTCEPTRLEKQLNKALEKPKKLVVGCSANYIYSDRVVKHIMPETHREITQRIKKIRNKRAMILGTILLPIEVLRKYPYNESLSYVQDWDHLLRLHESGDVEFYNLQEPLYNYNQCSPRSRNKPEWLDCNIFMRFCQKRRLKSQKEPETLKEFWIYLQERHLEYYYWLFLKKFIKANLVFTDLTSYIKNVLRNLTNRISPASRPTSQNERNRADG